MFLTSPEHYLHTSTRDKSLRTRYLQAAHNILGHTKLHIPSTTQKMEWFYGRHAWRSNDSFMFQYDSECILIISVSML